MSPLPQLASPLRACSSAREVSLVLPPLCACFIAPGLTGASGVPDQVHEFTPFVGDAVVTAESDLVEHPE
jgi:hypothetical protein